MTIRTAGVTIARRRAHSAKSEALRAPDHEGPYDTDALLLTGILFAVALVIAVQAVLQ